VNRLKAPIDGLDNRSFSRTGRLATSETHKTEDSGTNNWFDELVVIGFLRNQLLLEQIFLGTKGTSIDDALSRVGTDAGQRG
jgi:hypothetical protein